MSRSAPTFLPRSSALVEWLRIRFREKGNETKAVEVDGDAAVDAEGFDPITTSFGYYDTGLLASSADGLNRGQMVNLSSRWTLRSFEQIELGAMLINPFGGYDLYETRGLGPWARLVPRTLGVGDVEGLHFVLESRLPGADSRRLPDAERARVIPMALETIADLQSRTRSVTAVDAATLDRWVREPASHVRAVVRGTHRNALDALQARLIDALSGRAVARAVQATTAWAFATSRARCRLDGERPAMMTRNNRSPRRKATPSTKK